MCRWISSQFSRSPSKKVSRKGAKKYLFEVLSEERRDLPGVDRFPRQLAGGVVAAGKPDDVEGKLLATRLCDRFMRKIDREREIVARDEEAYRPVTHLRDARHER